GQTEVCLVGVRTKSKGSAIGLLSFPVTAEGEVHRCVVHLRLEELRVQLNCALKRLHRTVVVLELNEDQTARVVDRSVVRVLPLRLRSNECREIEALLVHPLLLAARNNEALLRTDLSARLVQVVERELVERRHEAIVDRESALQVELGARQIVGATGTARLAIALHLERREADEAF